MFSYFVDNLFLSTVLELLTYTSCFRAANIYIILQKLLSDYCHISSTANFQWFGFKKDELVGKSSRREPRFDHFKFFVSVALTLNVMTSNVQKP